MPLIVYSTAALTSLSDSLSYITFLFSEYSNSFIIGCLHMASSKHDYANYDQFVPNFDMACKTIQHVSVPDLTLFRSVKTGSWRIFYYVM